VFSQDTIFDHWKNKILPYLYLPVVKYSIQRDSFEVYHDKNVIPKSLMDTLIKWDSTFSFANPNEEYEATDETFYKNRPCRQIISVLKSKNYVFITYKHGGFGRHEHILWAKIENDLIRDIWVGDAYYDVKTEEQIRKVLKFIPQEFNANNSCF
jgi:hypothetical protein